ncbi:adipocyte plasma membrane-associated protein Hemomucin-like isoform X2 [Rhodnius prolixus]|uniref:adipocyte plasma membrane-associated protein Hemomucin-like isoform X2 n=1 Tax=Rhodnius prolixus TaxID=13249 RepID=UPI003D189ED6
MIVSTGKIFATLLSWLIKIGIVVMVLVFMPGLPPDMDFESYTLVGAPYQGALSINRKLNNAERLFEGVIKGPEDFAVHNNDLYTSCHGGVIYKVTSTKKLDPVLVTGKPCDGLHQEHICGRPLGFKFDKSGILYVADAYYGLLRSNLTSGTYETLVPMDQEIDGNRPMIPNSLAISDNVIYWTDSSTTHNLFDGVYTFLGNGRGRLLKYIISEKRSEVLLKNIHFANGIILSKDDSFIIIAETFRARLLRYYIRGPKVGTVETFVDNLPGFPDNIHSFGDDNIIVSLVMPLDNMAKTLGHCPLGRKLLARTLTLIESTFKILHHLCPTSVVEKIIHMLGHFEMLPMIIPPSNHSVSVVLDYKGNIVDSFHATDNTVTAVSGLVKFKNYYYLASPFNPYLARVKVQ